MSPTQYTEELLCQQQFLEVYLEGTRSRSGKPSPARAGMLSLVVDSLSTGSVADVLVVPVGISYDRIIEGNYNSEQLVSRQRGRDLQQSLTRLPVGADALILLLLLPTGQTQEEWELVGDRLRSVQDAQEELRLRPRRLQSAFLSEGTKCWLDVRLCTTFCCSSV